MKTLQKIRYILLGCLLWIATGCQNYFDINTDPNNIRPDQAPVNTLLTNVEVGVAFLVGNHLNLITSCWMQHNAGMGTQTAPYDVYQFQPADGESNTAWSVAYAQILPDIELLLKYARDNNDRSLLGIATALRVYMFSLVTDAWGDVPFTEAAKGEQGIIRPKYDTQQSIYAQLLADLEAALGNLSTTNPISAAASGDLIYNGNINSWRRFVNSLRIKLLVQSRVKEAARATTAINAIVASGEYITSNADNFQLRFGSAAGSQNPLYQYNYNSRPNDLGISPRLVDSMRVNNDPRFRFFFTFTSDANLASNAVTTVWDNGQGFVNGVGAATRSRWGIYVVNNGPNNTVSATAGAAPVRMLTASMVDFFLAEAALTLGTTGTASTYLDAALGDNFSDITGFVPNFASILTTFTVDAANYRNARVAAFNAAPSNTARLNILMREKWVSLVGNAFEAFNDIRRTGFPRLALAQNPALTQFPTNFPYPQQEINFNPVNIPGTPNSLVRKVWWMP